jgi:hypothetical protein
MNKRSITSLLFGAISLPLALDANASVISFDDFRAPSYFGFHTPLSERYAASGVHFQGTGTVLSSAATFDGVPGDSLNYLAFNGNVSSFPPETILFDTTIKSFKWDFAGTNGSATITAYMGDTRVGDATINAVFGVWNEMALSGSAFNRVVFTVRDTDPHFVIDNLTFTPATATVTATAPVPLPASLWLLLSGLLALGGLRKRRAG